MNESVGYTATLNIAIIFITIIIAFIVAALIYFKSNKVSNVIVNSIEKYEGYNDLSKNEISQKMDSIGYSKVNMSCNDRLKCDNGNLATLNSAFARAKSEIGYCVYECRDGKYYYYKVKSLLSFEFPILNQLVKYPIITSTTKMYDFE